MERTQAGKRRQWPVAGQNQVPNRRAKSDTAPHARKLADGYAPETRLWETPQAFFDELNGEFGFTLDVRPS